MTKLDDRIRQLAVEMAEVSPLSGEIPQRHRPRPKRRARGPVLFAVVALVAVAAAAYWPARGDEAGSVVDAGAPPAVAAPILTPQPRLTAASERSSPILDLAATGWLYPSQLPPGFEFDGALDLPTTRVLSFTHADGRVVVISFFESANTPPVGSEVVLVNGVEWLYSESVGGVLAGRSYEWGGLGVTFVGEGWIREDVLDFVASLEPAEAGDFPRPLFDVSNGEYTTVAEVIRDGAPLTLEVTTDGVQYGLVIRGSSFDTSATACCAELGAGQMILASGRVEPDLEVLARDGVADVLLYGLVDERVAEIRVVLSNGTTAVTLPQDISDAFDVDFFVVTFPVATQEFSDDGARVLAFDADGNEIGEGVL